MGSSLGLDCESKITLLTMLYTRSLITGRQSKRASGFFGEVRRKLWILEMVIYLIFSLWLVCILELSRYDDRPRTTDRQVGNRGVSVCGGFVTATLGYL